jgi:hypothetical protein
MHLQRLKAVLDHGAPGREVLDSLDLDACEASPVPLSLSSDNGEKSSSSSPLSSSSLAGCGGLGIASSTWATPSTP